MNFLPRRHVLTSFFIHKGLRSPLIQAGVALIATALAGAASAQSAAALPASITKQLPKGMNVLAAEKAGDLDGDGKTDYLIILAQPREADYRQTEKPAPARPMFIFLGQADGSFKLWDLVSLRSLSDQMLSSAGSANDSGIPVSAGSVQASAVTAATWTAVNRRGRPDRGRSVSPPSVAR